MIRFFDFLFSFLGLIILSPLLVLVFFIGLYENGSPLFIQGRVGYNLKSFSLIKFRTMPMGVRSAGTHLIRNIQLSSFGNFLRRTKIAMFEVTIPTQWTDIIRHSWPLAPKCLKSEKS